MQLRAFNDGERAFSSADLGTWAPRTVDRALERLRLFVRPALGLMGAAAARAAGCWLEDHSTEWRFHDVLAHGGMYVHVIADGTAFWELSARPLVFPQRNGDRPGAWSAVAGTREALTGGWVFGRPPKDSVNSTVDTPCWR